MLYGEHEKLGGTLDTHGDRQDSVEYRSSILCMANYKLSLIISGLGSLVLCGCVPYPAYNEIHFSTGRTLSSHHRKVAGPWWCKSYCG